MEKFKKCEYPKKKTQPAKLHSFAATVPIPQSPTFQAILSYL